MSHTDPQDDIPCTACEVEGSRSRLDEDGVCRPCRENLINRTFGMPQERPSRAAMRREIAAFGPSLGLHLLPVEVCDVR